MTGSQQNNLLRNTALRYAVAISLFLFGAVFSAATMLVIIAVIDGLQALL